MLEGLISLLTSTPGLVGIIGIVLMFVLALNKGSVFVPKVSDVTRINSETKTAEFMRGFIAIVVIGSSIYIILSQNFSGDTEKWAMGLIGTVVGAYFPK